MSTYSAFQTNPELEQNGIQLDLGGAGRFKLARAGGANKKFEKAMMLASKPHRRAMQAESIEEDTLRQILYSVYADAVLLGWEGVTGEDGQPLPFTKANAVKLFTDLPGLFDEIRNASQNRSYYLAAEREGDIKN